jgi:hypothetical protein
MHRKVIFPIQEEKTVKRFSNESVSSMIFMKVYDRFFNIIFASIKPKNADKTIFYQTGILQIQSL